MALKDRLFRNLGWKIGALVLSLALWFHLATEKIYEKKFMAEVKAVNLARNLEIENIEPAREQVSFIGTGKQLLQLMVSDDLKVYLDLSLVSRPGEYSRKVTAASLSDIDVSVFRSVIFTGGDSVRVVIKSKT